MKDKKIVLDVRSAGHLEAFWVKQDVLFLHVSILRVCRGVRVRSQASCAEAWWLEGEYVAAG